MLRISFNKVHRHTGVITAVSMYAIVLFTLATYIISQRAHAQSLPATQSATPSNVPQHSSNKLYVDSEETIAKQLQLNPTNSALQYGKAVDRTVVW